MSFNHRNNNTIYNDDSSSSSNSNICKYFLNGVCRFGDSCFYSHNLPETQSQSTQSLPNNNANSNICKYFLLGRCVFGESCFNQHSGPATTINTSESQNQNQNLVKRVLNKPKLQTSTNTEIKDECNSPQNPPSSYYEALTGSKMNYQDADNLNMFDQNYLDYMKQQSNQSRVEASQICPYFEKQLECPFKSECNFIHELLICDICNQACLNPYNLKEQQEHRIECMKVIEKEMEEAFAVQRSLEKQCGICMETIWQKEKLSDRRFGILENCNHCFCLECIRKWRSSKSYENKIVKACPECRVKSDYVTPSKYWFENEENKKKIIQDYKAELSKTQCKYFKQGDGNCPFGSKCFYLHQYKDGSLAQLPEPSKRRRFNRNGDLESYIPNLVQINFDIFDSDHDTDEFNIMLYLSQLQETDLDVTEESDSYDSDLFDLSNEFLNLFTH